MNKKSNAFSKSINRLPLMLLHMQSLVTDSLVCVVKKQIQPLSINLCIQEVQWLLLHPLSLTNRFHGLSVQDGLLQNCVGNTYPVSLSNKTNSTDPNVVQAPKNQTKMIPIVTAKTVPLKHIWILEKFQNLSKILKQNTKFVFYKR